MKIIDFDEAKARKHAREKSARNFQMADNEDMELQEQYRELVQFYERWYDEHVVGQSADGSWIYKNL